MERKRISSAKPHRVRLPPRGAEGEREKKNGEKGREEKRKRRERNRSPNDERERAGVRALRGGSRAFT